MIIIITQLLLQNKNNKFNHIDVQPLSLPKATAAAVGATQSDWHSWPA